MKRSRWLLTASLVLTAASFAFGQSAPPTGNHGAAPEAVQEAKLNELQKGMNPDDIVPPGVNEAYWNAMIPEGNVPNAAKVALGKKLYFDPKLSADGTVSCATCHDITRGFGDARPTSEGIDKMMNGKSEKQFGTRNAPTTLNTGFYHTLFWDGRSPSIEHQAMQPIINPVEMGMPEEEDRIIADIKDDPEYQRLFQEAYGRDVNYKDIGNAIGAFERTFVFMDNPFFKSVNQMAAAENPLAPVTFAADGDAPQGLTAQEWEGWKIFNREGRCNSCHQISPSNPMGSDNKFHNIGVAAHNRDFEALAKQALAALASDASDAALDQLALTTDMGELGRFLITKNQTDMGAFRTSMLLNVGITAPYMHDGSFATLWDVVDHYNKGGIKNLYLDGGIEPLNLTDEQVDALVAFLFTLTDSRFADMNQAEKERQQAMAKASRPEKNDNLASRKTLTFEKTDSNPKGGVQ